MSNIKNIDLTEFNGGSDFPKTSTDNVIDKKTGFSLDTLLDGLTSSLVDFFKNLYNYVPVFSTAVPSIPANSNLNDYITNGTYVVGNSTIAASIINTPYADGGYKLIVLRISTDARITQVVLTHNNFIYLRNCYHSVWSEWLMLNYMSRSMTRYSTAPVIQASYNSVINGTPPHTSGGGYVIKFNDSQNSLLAGLHLYCSSDGVYFTGLHNNWGNNNIGVGIYNDGDGSSLSPFEKDNVVNLGKAEYRWKQLYAGTTTIATSDERLKDNITTIPDAILDAWGEVGWYQYQFKDSIEEKGETKARIHTGTIAQRIKDIFDSHGLDAFRYGLLCYDEWDAEEEQKDEDGNITQEAREAGNRYSLRYEEALCMEAAYQRRRANRLEERIEALERKMNI